MTDSIATNAPTFPANTVRIAEQSATIRFWSASSTSPREIRINLRLSIPGEEGVDVDVAIDPGSRVQDEWIDALAPRIYDGVHGGIGRFGRRLPPEGLQVVVSDLQIYLDPLNARSASPDEIQRIGDALELLVASAIEGLLAGLIELSSV